MNFSDPIKSKNLFITFLIFSIIFFLSSGVLVYLYYRTNKNLQSANTDKQNLTNQLNDLKTASENIDAIIKENASNKASNADLNKQNGTFKAEIAKTKAYNNFFNFLNSVIKTHNGFTGWTVDEQTQAQALADKTNDDNIKNDVNTYWIDNTPVPVIATEVTRMLHFWNDISSGIENSL